MTQVGTSAALLDTGQYRRAQQSWATLSAAARIAVLRRFRHALGNSPQHLLESVAQHRGVSELEALASEIMPLAEACRWLESNSAKVLATRKATGSAPLLMHGLRIEIVREPLGLILIIAPGNYPLFLAGVQALQALAAGNAVLLKPAPNTTQLMTRLRDALLVAGLPMDLLTLLPEEIGGLDELISTPNGPDHIVVTGSARTGRAIQQLIVDSGRLVSLTAELSGADICIVLPDAELNGVARALRFAANLNRGRSCIAPRLVLVPLDRESEFINQIQLEFKHSTAEPYSHEESRRFAHVLSLATQLGAELVPIEDSSVAVLRRLPLDAGFPWEDLFSPLLFLACYRSLEEAIAIQRRMPQALSASVFGPHREAREIAERLEAGGVTINDLVAPTVDPRLPFTARKASGYGVTRGAEGLLAMTFAKAIATQHSRFRPHWERSKSGDKEILRQLFALQHAPLRCRFAACKALIHALLSRGRDVTKP
jgi:acyl-CoA reductase-like NAD-dependent aldehyde dehydrogenase